MSSADFWKDRRVLVTGHSGFKGGWLSLWLHGLGARVAGFALQPPTDPSLFEVAGVGGVLSENRFADIRDRAALAAALSAFQPEIVFHLAAQPIVLTSYEQPVETYAVNVMGTVILLDAVRTAPSVKAVVVATSDKCYENREWPWGYREDEALGGFDPYSSSKACAELVVSAYRRSFFQGRDGHAVAVASVRAGNVIGGGDWAPYRLVPDAIRAFADGVALQIRNPNQVRPWQHVLEPLSGYLTVGRRLLEGRVEVADAWNFGPSIESAKPVGAVVERLAEAWGPKARWQVLNAPQPHEAGFLHLDSSKARLKLGWRDRWSLDQALHRTVDWAKARAAGADMRRVCLSQIEAYGIDPTVG